MPYFNHVYFREKGRGQPLIFLHCPAVSSQYWLPAFTRLSSHFRCIAPDLRGHGRSGGGDRPWTFADIAADVTGLAEHLGLHQPVLVGYSSSCAIALTAALAQPDRFGALVLVSGFSECTGLVLQARVCLGLVAVALGLSPAVGASVVSTNHVDPGHKQAMLPDARAVRPAALRSFLKETLNVRLTGQLGRVFLPTLLAYGAEDSGLHGYAAKLHQGLANSRLVFFPHTDHRLPTRQPDRFAEMVEAHVEQMALGMLAPV